MVYESALSRRNDTTQSWSLDQKRQADSACLLPGLSLSAHQSLPLLGVAYFPRSFFANVVPALGGWGFEVVVGVCVRRLGNTSASWLLSSSCLMLCGKRTFWSQGIREILEVRGKELDGLTSERQFGMWGSVEGDTHTLLLTFDGQMLMTLPAIDQKQINNSVWPENGRKVLKCY